MTMSDLADYSYLIPPTSREDREAWFLEQEERIARKTRKALLGMIDDATNQFVNSLTATGDMSYFDQIPMRWAMYVDDFLMEDLQGMFLSGGLTSYITADGVVGLTEEIANQWINVVNQEAVDYALVATNRMKDVGSTTWNTIKNQVSNSIEKGTSSEDLKELLQKNKRFSEHRADTIARTETANAYLNGTWGGSQALGEYGPAYKYWINFTDNRTRASHIAAPSSNGVIPVGQPFNVGGQEMMYPHSPGAPAKEVVNCRCDLGQLFPGDINPFTGEVLGEPGVVSTPPPAAQTLEIKRVPGEGTPTGEAWNVKVPKFKTAKDAEDWLNKRWGTRYNGNAREFRLGDIHPDAATMIATELDDLIKRYPQVAEQLNKVGAGERFGKKLGSLSGLANSFDGSLYYREKDYLTESFLNHTTGAKQRNWWSSGNPAGTIHHEFGHHVHFYIERLNFKYASMPLTEAYLESGIAQVIKDTLGLKGKVGFTGARTKVAIAENLSRYASTDVCETIAEAFAESMSGAEVRSLAAAIRKWLDDEIAKFG